MGEQSITLGVLAPVVTVLIAAAGSDGRTARDRLDAAGFDVEHVTSLAAARVRAATVAVVVVGGLADATADDLRRALHGADIDTPLVHLGADETFDVVVEEPYDPDRLSAAVRLAEQAGIYREAVDEFYERCRERAAADGEDPVGDEAITAAKRRAEREFQEIGRLDDRSPFERLLGYATESPPADWTDGEENGGESTDGQT